MSVDHVIRLGFTGDLLTRPVEDLMAIGKIPKIKYTTYLQIESLYTETSSQSREKTNAYILVGALWSSITPRRLHANHLIDAAVRDTCVLFIFLSVP